MKNKHSYEIRDAYLFNAPLIIIAFVFIALPVLGTLITSFYRDVTFLPEKFIGIENYRLLLADAHFGQSVQFTMFFTFVSVVLELVIGMIFALVLNEVMPGRGLLRVAILIPWAIPVAIAGRVWELMYNFDYGLFNYCAVAVGLTDQPVSWLGSSIGAFISIVISDVWKTTPFISIIILSGLSTINENLYQQSMIDGAGVVQRFFSITLPLLRPVIVVALLFRTIDAVRIFDLIYVLTGGGPGGTTTSLSLYAYNYYVTGDFGYGSAVSAIVFLIASLLAFLYIKFGHFKEAVE
jgi:multiple sugar transport system permease protein